MLSVALSIYQAAAFVQVGAGGCLLPGKSACLPSGARVALGCGDPSAAPPAVNRAAQALIREAITTGVPIFNAGDASGCARVYEECCRDVIALSAVDANTGANMVSVLKDLPLLSSESEKAWVLRRQLDALLCLLASATPAPDAVAPSSTLNGSPAGNNQQVGSRKILADFSNAEVVASWMGVNDVVMGGRSTGFISYEVADTTAFGVFQGEVTARGGGGFSSIRSAPLDMDCSLSSGLSLLCRGDGRVYKLQVTCDQLAPGVKYQVEFETAAGGEWVEHRFRWADFAASLRGQRVLGAPALKGQADLTVTSMGLLTSKLSSTGTANSNFQSGAFRLELASISTLA